RRSGADHRRGPGRRGRHPAGASSPDAAAVPGVRTTVMGLPAFGNPGQPAYVPPPAPALSPMALMEASAHGVGSDAEAVEVRAGKAYHEFRLPHDSGAEGAAATALLIYGVLAAFFGLFRFVDERVDGEFTIGTDKDATFQTPEGLPAPLFPLVRSTGEDYEI